MENNEGYSGYRIGVPAEFETVFSHFYVAGNKTATPVTQTLLPSFQTMMVFNFGVPITFITQDSNVIAVEKCLVAGPIKQAFDYTLPPQSEIMAVNFKDDAFFRFFGDVAFSQTAGAHPDELLQDNCFTILWSQLHKLSSNEARVNHVLAFCKPYLQHRNPIASQLADWQDSNVSPVKEIAEKNNLSERSVQLHHKKQFGYSAKEIGRYQRFLKAIQLLQTIAAANNGKMDWFEIVDQCGYYDQSQLIHDFKHYLHLSPSQYWKFQQTICNPR